jgi:hypothetical protein
MNAAEKAAMIESIEELFKKMDMIYIPGSIAIGFDLKENGKYNAIKTQILRKLKEVA